MAYASSTLTAGTGRLQVQLSTGGAALAVTPDAAGDAAALSCTSLTWLPVANSGKVCLPSPQDGLAVGRHGRSCRALRSAASPGQKQSVSDGYNPRFGRSRQLPGRTSAPASFLQGAAPVLGERRQLNPVRRRSITGATARCVTHIPQPPFCHHSMIDHQPPHHHQFYRRASERRPSRLGCVSTCVQLPHHACVPLHNQTDDFSHPSSWALSSSAPAAAR